MRQLVLLVVAVLKCDKYSKIVCTCYDPDAGASEFCTELIEPTRSYTLLRTIDIEGRDWWVVRSLLGEVGDLDDPVFASGACGTARWSRVGVMPEGRSSILDFPVALEGSVGLP
jgi:hypothetical protein